MITADLTGNFGNQAMIYTIVRIVADKLGYEYGFNRKPSHDYYGGREQMYFLNIDYGKEHTATFGQLPKGVDKVWYESTFHSVKSNGDIVDFHPYCEDIWKIEDGTKLVIPSCQDARYFEGYKDKICQWLDYTIDAKRYFPEMISSSGISFKDNYCFINVRGGEYKTIPHVIVRPQYYYDAIGKMKEINPDMEFIIVTDDVEYARTLFPRYRCFHLGIGQDYYILNHAKNLILCNSSFAILPTFTNKDVKNIFAPAFWARHNVSTGYWASSDMWTFKEYGWKFLDRTGEIYDNL
jgi:hypothetical protein